MIRRLIRHVLQRFSVGSHLGAGKETLPHFTQPGNHPKSALRRDTIAAKAAGATEILPIFIAVRHWSGRRESNPRMQLGKLPFYH